MVKLHEPSYLMAGILLLPKAWACSKAHVACTIRYNFSCRVTNTHVQLLCTCSMMASHQRKIMQPQPCYTQSRQSTGTVVMRHTCCVSGTEACGCRLRLLLTKACCREGSRLKGAGGLTRNAAACSKSPAAKGGSRRGA